MLKIRRKYRRIKWLELKDYDSYAPVSAPSAEHDRSLSPRTLLRICCIERSKYLMRRSSLIVNRLSLAQKHLRMLFLTPLEADDGKFLALINACGAFVSLVRQL